MTVRQPAPLLILMGPLLILLGSSLFFMSSGCRLDSAASFGTDESNPLAFESPDVFGNMVSVGTPTEDVTVLFFVGPATSDAMQPITTDVAVTFREESNLRFVAVIDLSVLAFYEKPFAPGRMQGAHGRTVRRVNRRLEERELPPIEGLGDAMFFIADDNGVIAERYGVANSNETITCVVFRQNGQEIGRFHPEDEDELERVKEAVRIGMGGSGLELQETGIDETF